MEWTKATIRTTAQGADIIVGMLMELGICGVEINDPKEMASFIESHTSHWDYIDDALQSQIDNCEEDAVSIIFYVGTDNESAVLLRDVNRELERLRCMLCCNTSYGSLALDTDTVNDDVWLHEWKKYFQPICIGKVLIVPEWDAATYERDIIFRIDPGSAFGTGQHATTMLCIEVLQRYLCAGSTVLDIGCGSGILSVISLLLGAEQVISCDIDPVAVEVTRKNAALNPVCPAKLHVYAGDILVNHELQQKINQNKYDIVIANIAADVIKRLSSQVSCLLKPGGVFIASGIIEERLDDVLSALSANRLHVVESKILDGWCCVVANG